jgi:hypothetical protein
MFQGLPIQILHDDEGATILLVNLMDGADIWMIERRSGASLTAETFQRLMIFGYVVRKEFQRNKAPQLGVFRLVDDSHTTTAKLFKDAIVGDGFADHVWPVAYRQRRQC